MEGILPIIIQLLGGGLGGNLAGSLLKKFSMGTMGNTILGLLGGGLGGQLLGNVLGGGGGGTLDIMSILSNVASGGVGGGALMTIVGLIRSMMAKK
jgi:hypothetical protein